MSTTRGIYRLVVTSRAMTRRLLRDRKGFAAVEFAMVVPIMLMLYIGSVEVCEGLSLQQRVTSIARDTADLAAQVTSVTPADLTDIMRISDSLLGGYDPTRLKVTLVSILADAQGDPYVQWSVARDGSIPYAKGAAYTTLEIGLVAPGQGIIISNVSYTFRPPIAHFIVDELELGESFSLSPRKSASVVCPTCP